MVDLEFIRRNSRISLDREGRFYHEGERIENDRIQGVFRRGIQVRADGEVTLHVGKQWCYVECEDTALFIVSIGLHSNSDDVPLFELTLSDETREALDVSTLEFVGESDLYCLVKSGSVRGRFLRGAYHQMAEHLLSTDLDAVAAVLQLGNEQILIPQK